MAGAVVSRWSWLISSVWIKFITGLPYPGLLWILFPSSSPLALFSRHIYDYNSFNRPVTRVFSSAKGWKDKFPLRSDYLVMSTYLYSHKSKKKLSHGAFFFYRAGLDSLQYNFTSCFHHEQALDKSIKEKLPFNRQKPPAKTEHKWDSSSVSPKQPHRQRILA